MSGIIVLHTLSFLVLLRLSKSSMLVMVSGGGSLSSTLFAISFLILGSISECGLAGVPSSRVFGSVVVGIPP